MITAIRKNQLCLSLAATFAVTVLAGCGKREEAPATPGGNPTATAPTEDKTAKLTYVNWAEGVAYTHLAKAVLEDKMGYEVTITEADLGPAYMAVGKGDMDAFMESWPSTQQSYLDTLEGKLVDLGHVYEGTALGLVVPSYVTINKISELNSHKDKFDGRIVGIDPGAGMMKATEEQVIPKYGLELRLMPSSGPAMTAALSKAIENKEWIVVTGWRPHWMFGRWDLKILEQDEDKIVWQEGNIHIMGRIGIERDKPELARFLKNMMLTDAQISDLMLKIKESDEDTLTVARTWMQENEDVVSKWIPAK